MALRIEASVIRGEIDNRERSWVRGRIWIYDRGQPITLELAGNCLSDLAGRLTPLCGETAFDPSVLASIPDRVQGRQELFEATGGVPADRHFDP